MPTIEVLTACQARAARAMLDVTQEQLAERSGMKHMTVRRIETGFGEPEGVSLKLRISLQEYFEKRGFTFMRDTNMGVGVFWNRNRGRKERRSGAGDRRSQP
jgi:transcriptional regulator with XRE-family HTH domain